MFTKIKYFLWRGIHLYYKLLPKITLRRLYVPLTKVPINKPIFFLGVQGGGLTIIARSIKRHNNVVSMRGNNTFWTGQDELDSQKEVPKELSILFPENGKTIVKTELFGKERLWWTYATNDLYNTYYANEKIFSKELDKKTKKLIKSFIRGYAHNISSARYCEKSQLFTIKVRLLKKIFPDAKFILVYRNPYAICHRIASKNYSSFTSGNIKNMSFEDRLKIAAQHWKNNYQTALKDFKNAGIDYYDVKIEDYLNNPKTYLDEILHFCQLKPQNDLLPKPNHKLPFGSLDTEKWYPLQKDINSKYLKKITQKEKKIIQKEIGIRLLKKIGYN